MRHVIHSGETTNRDEAEAILRGTLRSALSTNVEPGSILVQLQVCL